MSEIRQNSAVTGVNLDSTTSNIQQGQLTYALNVVVEGFDGNSVTYQNEQGNSFCGTPKDLVVIGHKFIPNKGKTVLFLTNNTSHEIGIHDLNTCQYTTIISGSCLNFHTDFPIHKSVFKVVENGEVEIYWADRRNPMRYLNIDNPPYLSSIKDCEEQVSTELDCNKLKVQPNVKFPQLVLKEIRDGGDLQEGTYQFAVQYANGRGEAYTSFYLTSNPISLGNPSIVSTQFDGGVDKSIVLDILNIDNTGIYEYLNIAVIKKINNISSIELIDTVRISGPKLTITYSGQSKQDVRLTANDLFEKFTLYSKAGDVISSGDIIIWSELWTKERIDYQKIWRKVKLEWQSWVLPYSQGETYAKAENTFYYKGYMRDEIYALEGAFLLDDGTVTDAFHIPSRPAEPYDLELITNEDATESGDKCEPGVAGKPRWQVYNTARVTQSKPPFCEEVVYSPPPSGPVSPAMIKGTITLICPDKKCTEQGNTILEFTLEQPLQEAVTLHMGYIMDNMGNLRARGYDIFTPPPGVSKDVAWNPAFVVTLPAGVTEITTPVLIHTTNPVYAPNGNRVDTWTCHNCLFPVVDIYIKPLNHPGINFSTTQAINIHNLKDENYQAPEGDDGEALPPPPVENPKPCLENCYVGPYESGDFAYHESTDYYPCDSEVWGELANTPIRHHKFPDTLVSPHHDNLGNVYPLGIKVNIDQIKQLIDESDLSEDQKKRIIGFTIVRGNRASNKTVVAKGLLYNVGVYKKDDQEYYYPNYPYNDLREDPFILSDRLSVIDSSGGATDCYIYNVQAGEPNRNGDFEGEVTIQYVTCEGVTLTETFSGKRGFCAQNYPDIIAGTATITMGTVCGTPPEPETSNNNNSKIQLSGFETDLSRERYTFHSPDTHFFQPFLGSELRIESIEHGVSHGHFAKVKNHAKYGFISKRGYTRYIIPIANALGFAAGWDNGVYGGGAITIIAIFSAPTYDPGRAVTTVFQSVITLIEIAEKIIPKLNFAYQFNSIGKYDNIIPIQNQGNKVRKIDFSQYVISGFQSVGENRTLNNYARESSVYLKLSKQLPYTHEVAGPQDTSRWILSEEGNCKEPTKIETRPIASYYGAIKKNIPNPYGTLYSYETVSTGFQHLFKGGNEGSITIFGGDTFINKFALKRKQAYFFDHRVNAPDQSDVDYRDFFNIGYVKYWISTDYTGGGGVLSKLYGIKQNSFDCQDDEFIYQKGKFYLFSYGIPYFFCESEVNVDLRKATNGKEGDYYPRVSSGIPDEWLQEINVPIIQDNTYFYNKTFSTQNKENLITHIPEDFNPEKDSVKYLSNRAFYSDPQGEYVNYKRNNWLIYRPVSYFDFPLKHGKLVALESLEHNQILARFENKSLIYNALLRMPSTAGEVYVGQQIFSRDVPPLDFVEIDFGFNGTINKLFIKTEHGNISVDAQKGQIFLMKGQSIEELSSLKYNWSKFFAANLPFKIREYFNIPVDNHFQRLGLHGVYDMQNDRVIITKFDYEPLIEGITYTEGKFYHNGNEISLQDTNYFCNRSFTASFSFITNSWIGFHSYLPNYYVGTGTDFLSGINGSIWKHNKQVLKYNHFYGEVHPYILEYPFNYKGPDEVIQSVSDYTKVFKQLTKDQSVAVDNVYFNKAIIYNSQACTGEMELIHKPKNNMGAYLTYPKYTPTGKQILFSKTANMYHYNSITNQVINSSAPFWTKSCKSLSLDKELIGSNIDMKKRSFNTGLIRGRDSKIRHILDNTSDYRFISQFIITINQNSHI